MLVIPSNMITHWFGKLSNLTFLWAAWLACCPSIWAQNLICLLRAQWYMGQTVPGPIRHLLWISPSPLVTQWFLNMCQIINQPEQNTSWSQTFRWINANLYLAGIACLQMSKLAFFRISWLSRNTFSGDVFFPDSRVPRKKDGHKGNTKKEQAKQMWGTSVPFTLTPLRSIKSGGLFFIYIFLLLSHWVLLATNCNNTRAWKVKCNQFLESE